MNHWNIGQLPYSWAPKNVTCAWAGTDSLENYNKNPNKDEWENIDITYQYNTQGFRCTDLTNFLGQQINIALGCSFTEGIGLAIDQVWPSLLEQQLKHPVVNLGLGSGTTDTVARILTNISTLYNIHTVYILWPNLHRFEACYTIDDFGSKVKNAVWKVREPPDTAPTYRHLITPILPMTTQIEYTWALTDEMANQRFNRNKSTVDLLAQVGNFRIVQYTVDDVITKFRSFNGTENYLRDSARDGQHWGADTQKAISTMMLSS